MRAGLTRQQLQQAFGIDASVDITQFNALADAIQNPGGSGLAILKVRLLQCMYKTSSHACVLGGCWLQDSGQCMRQHVHT